MSPFLVPSLAIWPLMIASLQQPILLPDDGAFHPVPEPVARFLRDQFAKVPAGIVVDKIPSSTCRLDLFDEPDPSFKGAYYCMVDFGCDELQGVPVWFDDYSLYLGPDSAGRLMAMWCPGSITDRERREYFAGQIRQGG